MARYLVTGGAGFVGSHLVAALLAQGDDCVVLDDLSTGHAGAVLPGARLVRGSLADAAAVEAVLSDGGWDAVFHFAALSLVGDSMRAPMHYLATNLGNGLRLIDACVRHGVTRFVLSSTAALFGEPERSPIDETVRIEPGSPYGESKWMLERSPALGRPHPRPAQCRAALLQRRRRREDRPRQPRRRGGPFESCPRAASSAKLLQ